MVEIVIGLFLMLWDFLKPTLIGGSYVLLVVGIFKWWILDDITDKINDAVRHLSVIERDVESVKDYLSEIKSTTSSIEKEMDWWGDANTLAKQIIKRLDAIERK